MEPKTPAQILQEITEEFNSQKEEMVNRLVEQKLKNLMITEKNISPALIALIMAKSGASGGGSATQSIPVPSKKSIPSTQDEESSASPLLKNPLIQQIVDDILVGNNVYFYGKAGTGKTYLSEKICEKILKRPYITINCSQWTSPIDIIGGQTIEGYKQGRLSEAWGGSEEFPDGAVIILDELPKLDPNTAGLLNTALAKTADIDGKMTDGKGARLVRKPLFACIANGNTDMKSLSPNFSGNNRQDYSLVDRFAGSYYKIEYDEAAERDNTYSFVYDIMAGPGSLRAYLDSDLSSMESVSMRTLLNMNRTFEQEMLRRIESPLANDTVPDPGMGFEMAQGKTFVQAMYSFINTLPLTKVTQIENATTITQAMRASPDIEVFIKEFKRMHCGIDPQNPPKDLECGDNPLKPKKVVGKK